MKLVTVNNLFADLLAPPSQEHFQTLLETSDLRIERIVSHGECSPKDFWYDQEQNEWVLLLKGTASLQFGNGSVVDLAAGDYLLIQSHVRHRVEHVSADAVWLAVHYHHHAGSPAKMKTS